MGVVVRASSKTRQDGIQTGERLHAALFFGEQRQPGPAPGLHEAFLRHGYPDASARPVADLQPALRGWDVAALREGAGFHEPAPAHAGANVLAQQ
jgi:hypothetical protein